MKMIHLYGNWKMNMLPDEGVSFARALAERASGPLYSANTVDICLFPPFVTIGAVRHALATGGGLSVGAQDGYTEDRGAYTGAVSLAMVRDLGCTHVLVGHSERRSLFGDDDGVVAKKLKRALDLGLKAVLCFGETLAERESGATTGVVDRQLTTALEGVPGDSMRNVLLAYEPVWAIGTGKNASPEDAQAVCEHVRDGIRKKYGTAVTVPVLYGGSVNEKNAAGLFAQPDIDGGLVGGASLNVERFLGIYESYRRAAGDL